MRDIPLFAGAATGTVGSLAAVYLVGGDLSIARIGFTMITCFVGALLGNFIWEIKECRRLNRTN